MTDNIGYRIEHDTMGQVNVPSDKYWGAQTQRSLENFRIGRHKMPGQIIHAFGVLKKAAAIVNTELGGLDKERGDLISVVCDEIIEGKLNQHFPLVVYQTGSGTQSNMNVNEVIANRGNEIIGKKILHPNDHVNKSQSSNDTFPTAMHICALMETKDRLIPALQGLRETLFCLEEKYMDIVKTGRTHLQDATPITLGQEISGWRSMLDHCEKMILSSICEIRELALGGTAVGTGLNCHRDFGRLVAAEISRITGENFITAENKFHSLTSKDGLTFVHGAIKSLASDLLKIANDVRWLASGPRCGIGEIYIPENEPGSSIMPGKVNPTQCEALSMACIQVLGNDVTIGLAASQGNFQLNVYMPVIIYNFLESIELLSDAMISFNKNCISGLTPNYSKIEENIEKSLMLVTALNPYIGYEKAAQIAKLAYKEGITLRSANNRLGFIKEEDFDNWLDPKKMV